MRSVTLGIALGDHPTEVPRPGIRSACLAAVGSLLVLTAWAARAQSDPRLREIIENVRTNEELYRNLEVRLGKTYRLGEPINPEPEPFKSGDGKARFVYQDGMFYYRNDEKLVTLSDKEYNADVIEGFDGEKTRLVEQNAFANIHEGRAEDPRLFQPHCMFLGLGNSAGVTFPLSTYLRGGKVVRAYPRYSNAEVTTRYEGEEVVDGLRCFKIRVDYHLDSWKFKDTDVRYIWLAPERNYLPVRTECRLHWLMDRPPQEVGVAEDFREIAPGVWFSFRASLTVYNTTRLYYDKKLVVCNKTELTVDQANLDPHYDISLSRDIPIPDGMVVYVVRNGKIVQRYIQGGRRFSEPGRSSNWWLIGSGIALSLVVLPSLFLLYRRMHPRRITTST